LELNEYYIVPDRTDKIIIERNPSGGFDITITDKKELLTLRNLQSYKDTIEKEMVFHAEEVSEFYVKIKEKIE
jgi:hypothetical protein